MNDRFYQTLERTFDQNELLIETNEQLTKALQEAIKALATDGTHTWLCGSLIEVLEQCNEKIEEFYGSRARLLMRRDKWE